MKKGLIFLIIRLVILFSIINLLSCGRTSNILDHLDDDFLSGTTEGLYRMQDLEMIVDQKTVTFQKASDEQFLKDYQTVLSTKENLYEENKKANVLSLKELLKIRTAKKGKKVKISSSFNVFIDPEIPFLNEYEILDYTVAKPKTRQQKILQKLLGEITEFKGFPDTDYYILPYFVGNYLILYKLGPPDKIPYNELPLSKRIGDMLAVPFVGYPVEYCEAVKVLDSNIRETRKSRPLCKGVKLDKPVKYIRLWAHKKQVFQYLQKLDFFQKDFFEGEWFHSRTLIRSPSDRITHIEHSSFQSARLVKFHPSLGKMDVVEMHNLKQDDERRALFIPVRWTDYEIARDSENLHRSFSERLKEDIHEVNRPYLEIKFDELITNEFVYVEKGGKSLKSVVIAKDYISFDIEITSKGRVAYLIKLAFKRYIKNSDYVEKQWFQKDDLLFFPLSKVKRRYYEDLADHTEADLNRFQRITRFDPKSKEIVWHFSKNTSSLQWIRNLGREAVKRLNKSFQEAGRGSDYKIKVTLNKNGADKEVGDMRYNVLNLILSEGETPEQFWWGQNIANPVTGEIISTTANVWINLILKEYISLVRRYIRFHIYPPPWKMKPFSKETVTFIRENVDTKNLQCSDLSDSPLAVTPFLHEKIQRVCEEVSIFIDKHKGKEKFHPRTSILPDENVVNSCVQKLAREKILHSILHSMLHSLGLKDMKSASVDKENFYKAGEIEILFGKSASEVTTNSHPDPPQYSSVMDYTDLEYPSLPVPGKLDIAALRFLYFDRVEKKEEGFLHVPSGADKDPKNPQKSILEAADFKGYSKENLKEYKICGWDSEHPLFCERNDYGANPMEIVVNGICKIHNYSISSRNRYDGKKVEIEDDDIHRRMKPQYEKWIEYRDNILARKNKSILDYSFLNPDHIEEYNQAIESIKDHPDIRPYYLVREPIFDYFKRTALVPAKHCIYREGPDEGGNFHYSAIALGNIEEKILREYPENSEKDSEVFMNCESQIVTDWIGESKKLVAEVGFFQKDRRYLIRPNKKTDSIDEETVFKHNLNSFVKTYENIIEEPEFGDKYYREWLAYVTEGVDLNPYIDRDAIKDPDIPRNIQLERVVSYKIDTEQLKGSDLSMNKWFSDNLWLFRWEAIKKYKEKLWKDYANIENRQLFSLHFFYRTFHLTDLRDYVDSTPMHHGLHNSELPFLIQAYREYENKQKEKGENKSFEEFIQTHPAVFYNSDESLFLIPYSDEEINVPSILFRQYDQFVKCVEEQENSGKPCNGIEEKQAFITFMLGNYK